MSIVDHYGEVEYPFSQKTVFKAIMEAAPDINGLSLESADEISGRVTFKAGISLANWGENIPVQLIKVGPTRTQMKIMSTPKTGVITDILRPGFDSWAGNIPWGREWLPTPVPLPGKSHGQRLQSMRSQRVRQN